MKQDPYSFLPPRKKESLRALRRSWDCGNCRDKTSYGWAMTTISATCTLGTRGSRGHNHLMMSHLLFGFGDPDSAALSTVGLGRSLRLRDELSAIALRSVVFDCA